MAEVVVFPMYAFELVAAAAGLETVEHLGFDPNTQQVLWLPPVYGPHRGGQEFAPEASALLMAEVTDDGDVVFVHTIDDGEERVLVNLNRPDLDPTDYLPDDTWRQHAECVGFTHLFYPDETDTTAATQAKEICRQCPVAAECLIHTIVTNERMGVRAMLGEDQRRRVRKLFVTNPDDFVAKVPVWIDLLRAGSLPEIIRNRNTEGATCGHRSTYNRGCRCKACTAASSYASLTRRESQTEDLYAQAEALGFAV